MSDTRFARECVWSAALVGECPPWWLRECNNKELASWRRWLETLLALQSQLRYRIFFRRSDGGDLVSAIPISGTSGGSEAAVESAPELPPILQRGPEPCSPALSRCR